MPGIGTLGRSSPPVYGVRIQGFGFKIEGFEIRDLRDLEFGVIGGNRVEAHLLFQHFVCGVFWRQRIEWASEDGRASERESGSARAHARE